MVAKRSKGEKGEAKKQLFFTTSDLINRLNNNLEDLDEPDTEEGLSPRFELQKRLPDGSTRKAHVDELASSDMQTKLKQAAEQVGNLSTAKEKLEWAKRQRQEGNKLYGAGEYKEAVDVYLTCLVAKPDGDQYMYSIEVLLPVLNNLAQSTLQLGLWRKTDQFCTIVLKEIIPDETKEETRKLMAKIYFRRGKSRRLQGLYLEARKDLNEALRLLGSEETPERKELLREIQKVKQAVVVGRENQKQQGYAMQQILGGQQNEQAKERIDPSTLSKDGQLTAKVVSSASSNKGLYSDVRQRRKFSTLKAAPKASSNFANTASSEDDEYFDNEHVQLSCWKNCLLVIARLAKKALGIIGDEEAKKC